MKYVIVRYSIGYGYHEMTLSFEDAITDKEIEEDVGSAFLEKMEWSWEFIDKTKNE